MNYPLMPTIERSMLPPIALSDIKGMVGPWVECRAERCCYRYDTVGAIVAVQNWDDECTIRNPDLRRQELDCQVLAAGYILYEQAPMWMQTMYMVMREGISPSKVGR